MRRVIAVLLVNIFIFSNILCASAVQQKDTAAPALLSSFPASGQQNVGITQPISITFNEAVLKGTTFTKISLTDKSNKTIALNLSVKDKVVTAAFSGRLAFSTDYTVTIPSGAVKDSSGNSLANQQVIHFKTISSVDSLKEELKTVVSGLKKISVSYPGALETSGSEWLPLISGNKTAANTVFAAARKYGYGRILALGKDDILQNDIIYTLDNLLFLKNAMKWLGGGKKRIGYSTGHSEFVNAASVAKLKKELEKDKFTVRQTKLTAGELKNLDILIVGNAWTNLTNEEINCVKNFTAGGGGLVLAGLGWSFDAYNPGKNYPMNTLSSSFEVKWSKAVIPDTPEKYQNQPVFTVFFPNAAAPAKPKDVTIEFYSSEAKEVFLYTDFYNWTFNKKVPMTKDGNWFSAKIPAADKSQYKFRINDIWYSDPYSIDRKIFDNPHVTYKNILDETNLDPSIQVFTSADFDYFTMYGTDRTSELEAIYGKLTENILKGFDIQKKKIRYYAVKYADDADLITMTDSGEIYDGKDCASSHEIIHCFYHPSNAGFAEGFAQCFQYEGNSIAREYNVSLYSKWILQNEKDIDLLGLINRSINSNSGAWNDYVEMASFVYYNVFVMNKRDNFSKFLDALKFDDTIAVLESNYSNTMGVDLETAIKNWKDWLLSINENSDVYVNWDFDTQQ